ncbi:MAG: TrkA family potassium uptake protein [Bacilli bacterium]|jgi:trk system potassium uptake protein TrkA|nr:TrkA family potassium uptake protein [Bacilli bacterium]MCH4202436.1 TrkA family potassium uptake protein [Bacilli bacterium]MCH4235469.1 TrkA family potassium uptake protein [Bacilli bacterium]HML99747.1 TrkA family potassium uptake protein [Bacilli bacterium]
MTNSNEKKTFVVIGLGQFGMSIVEELVSLNKDVIALDKDEEAVRIASELTPTAFVCDSTNEKALRELEIQNVSHAIVCYGDNTVASILTTVLLVSMNIKHVIVRMDNETYIPIIKKLGATEVVTPQRLAGLGLANRLGNDDFLDYYSLAGDYSVVKITIRNDYRPVTIQALNPRNEFGVNLILIQRGGKTFAPKALDKIHPGDIVFVVGLNGDIEDFSNFINKEPIEHAGN